MPKSMALQGLDENSPRDCAKWFEDVVEPLTDVYPEVAIVSIGGRQKGWAVGMDSRQGRGSSALLHEVTAQYMLWPKTPGSREKDGEARLVATKCRYGYRPEGSIAGRWLFGPGGFDLVAPVIEVEESPEDKAIRVREWLAEHPRDERDLPPTEAAVAGALSIALEDVREAVNASDDMHRKDLPQPGKRGTRPFRVWIGEARDWGE